MGRPRKVAGIQSLSPGRCWLFGGGIRGSEVGNIRVVFDGLLERLRRIGLLVLREHYSDAAGGSDHTILRRVNLIRQKRDVQQRHSQGDFYLVGYLSMDELREQQRGRARKITLPNEQQCD